MSLIVPLLVAVTGLQLSSTIVAADEQPMPPQADPTMVPTAEECTTDGVFCFEVSKGPKYAYKIQKEDDPPLFTALGKRMTQNEDGNNRHSWSLNLDKSIDEGEAAIMFVPSDGTPALLKMVLKREVGEMPRIKLYRREDAAATWKQVVRDIKDFITEVKPEDNSVSFQTSEKFDGQMGLETKNQTIDFTLKMEIMNGDSVGEVISFQTKDVHVHFKDNPEIREWRERRLAEQRQEAADLMTIVIIAVVVALIVIAGIVFAVLKFRK